jgi:hypothetical protein
MMKKRSLLLTIFFITIVLAGCQSNGAEVALSSGNPVTVQQLPEIMPSDFNFSIAFGVGKRNEINTFDGTVTKDLISDGTKTVDLKFNDEEMSAIYVKMKEVKINETKEFVPAGGCRREPYEEDEWKIKVDRETITLYISGEYCDPTYDAKQLIQLRNYIFSIVKGKDAYQSLPKPSGAYE